MAATATDVVYDLSGTLLEACSCGVLCPCWIGEDPDQGTCEAFLGYHFDSGTIRGVDVSGLNMVGVAKIPGNVLEGNWRVVFFIDDSASDEQRDGLLAAYGGDLGGPLADLAQLVGEVVDVVKAPIKHEVVDGAGTLKVGDFIESAMEPYRAPDGQTITTLRDSVFSTVPGSPAYVSKASLHKVNLPQYDMVWSFEGRNAIQADYRMTHTG
jgi:hypothetical protein